MHAPLFTAALGLSEPWYVKGLDFDEAEKRLTVQVDFRRGSRFAHGDGSHPVHDTQLKRHRHLNFFEHECVLEARVPRVRLPDGRVALVKPPWAGRLSGFPLLFEALVLSLCREMPFAAVARLTGVSWHRVVAVRTRYADLAVAAGNLRGLRAVAIDETSRAKGHDYVTVVADAKARRVVFVDRGKGAATVGRFAGGTRQARRRPRAPSKPPPSTCPAPTSRASPSTCPTPRSPSTSSMSSPWPRRRWTRHGASSNAATPASRACAGRC